jgi:hypothetical protein
LFFNFFSRDSIRLAFGEMAPRLLSRCSAFDTLT